MSNTAPIGVFDSGLGGLTVLHALQQQLPHESFIYVADNGHAPYGDKPPAFIIQRSLAIAQYLRTHQAKALVIACNTATAAAAHVLRQTWPDWPIIGIEPAVKPAAMITKTGVVGILATTNTLASDKFRQLISRFSENAKIVVQACPGLVEEIERGNLDSPRLHQLLAEYVGALRQAGADVIVLGCTHYPFVQAQIQTLAGAGVVVIETGEAVARETSRQLALKHIKNMANVAFPHTAILQATGKLDGIVKMSKKNIRVSKIENVSI